MEIEDIMVDHIEKQTEKQTQNHIDNDIDNQAAVSDEEAVRIQDSDMEIEIGIENADGGNAGNPEKEIREKEIPEKEIPIEEIPIKEIQIKKWFFLFLIPLLVLLLLRGMEQILKTQGIQYRSWLAVSISIGLFFIVPFLFFTFLELLLEYWKKRKKRRFFSVFSGLLQIILIGLIGFYIPMMGFFCLLTFESIYEVEQEIGDGYIEGTTQEFLGANDEKSYRYYTKVSFFGKKKYEDSLNIVKMKMEQKYGEKFQVTQAEDADVSETWEGHGYLAIPETMPEITVHVFDHQYAYPFFNDYVVQRAAYQGSRYQSENRPDRSYQIIYDNSNMKEFDGYLHINCMGSADTRQCAKDVSDTMNTILEDPFMQDKFTQLYIDCYRDEAGGTYELGGRNIDVNEQMANISFYISEGKSVLVDCQTVLNDKNQEQELYKVLVQKYEELEKIDGNTRKNSNDDVQAEEEITGNNGKQTAEGLTGNDGKQITEDLTGNEDEQKAEGLTGNNGKQTAEDLTGNNGKQTDEVINRDNDVQENVNKNITDKDISNKEMINKNTIQDDIQDMPDTSDNSTPEGAYMTLYKTIFQPEGDAYQPAYNAKGNFYAVLSVGSEEIDGEIQNYRRTVVYDRESKNGKCLLFVAYKEYTYFDGSTGNTAILNFYAVEKSTGKVVAGNKKAWADVGSEEYREITGE